MKETLLHIGSAVSILWGIAHVIPLINAIKGTGDIPVNYRRVLLMGIISGGLTLIFLGVLPLLIVYLGFPVSINGLIVYRAEGAMLLAMAAVTLFTGTRTPAVWYKFSPIVEAIAAVLFIQASII